MFNQFGGPLPEDSFAIPMTGLIAMALCLLPFVLVAVFFVQYNVLKSRYNKQLLQPTSTNQDKLAVHSLERQVKTARTRIFASLLATALLPLFLIGVVVLFR